MHLSLYRRPCTTAFHPDLEMKTIEAPSLQSHDRALSIALSEGLKLVCNNERDVGQTTRSCASCGDTLIAKNWHRILPNRISPNSRYADCLSPLRQCCEMFSGQFGNWRTRQSTNAVLNMPF